MIKIAIVYKTPDVVVFRIAEQEPQRIQFKASNGFLLKSISSPDITPGTLFLRGSNTYEDDKLLFCYNRVLFDTMIEALREFNQGDDPIIDLQPKTQKAQGIQHITLFGKMSNRLTSYLAQPDGTLLKLPALTPDTTPLADLMRDSTLFIRPCPKRPRHGFVESRQTSNLAYDLKVVRQEMLDAGEPDGEIIVSPFIEAEFNAILTNSSLTIGKGNDGATAGRDSIFISSTEQKLSQTNLFYFPYPSQSICIETVTRKNKLTITQIREIPADVSINRDFIPKPTIVKHVLTPSPATNLLKWEQTIKRVEPGTVVYLKQASTSSHLGIHCIINDVPCITSFMPIIGSYIEPTKTKELQLSKLADAINRFLHEPTIGEPKDVAELSVAGLHMYPSLLIDPSDTMVKLFAFAVANAYKTAYALCMGEVRRAWDKGPALESLRAIADQSRESIYRDVLTNKLDSPTIQQLADIFSLERWQYQYGGKPWAECAQATADYFNIVNNFIERPTRNKLLRLVKRFNRLINLAHNCGWWWNKVMSKDEFEDYSHCPLLAYLRNQALAWSIAKQEVLSDESTV